MQLYSFCPSGSDSLLDGTLHPGPPQVQILRRRCDRDAADKRRPPGHPGWIAAGVVPAHLVLQDTGIRSVRGGTTMQSPIRHRDGSHDHRRGTAGPAGPRSRRLSSAAAGVAGIALAALAAALIVFLGDLALDLIVAILVLVAAGAARATRPVRAFLWRGEPSG